MLNKRKLILMDSTIIILTFIGLYITYNSILPKYYYLWKCVIIIKFETIPLFTMIFTIGLILNLILTYIFLKI